MKTPWRGKVESSGEWELRSLTLGSIQWMVSIILKHAQWWVLGMEKKGTGRNETEREGLVGAVRNRF